MCKKKYNKPEIFFEDFTLSTNIAASCEFEPINNAAECGVQYFTDVIFVEGISGCFQKVENGDPNYNGLCYHNPSDLNVFNS